MLERSAEALHNGGMAMLDLFRSERRKWRTPLASAGMRPSHSLSSMDARSRELFETALPRGVLLPRLLPDRERMNYWMSPTELMRHRYVDGQLVLGKFGRHVLGHMDDRPLVTIAQSRAGKTSTVIEPNILCYAGSILALDPKGGLAQLARYRRALGHMVYVWDPFGQSGESSASFNPLAELDPRSLTIVDDVGAVTRALVPDDGDSRAKHWNDNARKLLEGLILLVLTFDRSERNLVTVRDLLCLSYGPLVARVNLAIMSLSEKDTYFDANAVAVTTLLNEMVKLGPMFGGTAANIGNRYLNTPKTERGSIFSTAATHTDFLDSLLLRRTLRRSDFKLRDLRGDQPVTIFLCLPVGQMEQQSPFLRLIVQLACLTLERMGRYPRDRSPILFLMEEFATLGHMDCMEHAAAYFPEFGVKLWAILQNVTQLQRHYREGWQTILGNAGLIQLFANGDDETLRFAAGRVEKLITPSEIRVAFARERQSQLLLVNGLPPAATLRLEHKDVETIRRRLDTLL